VEPRAARHLGGELAGRPAGVAEQQADVRRRRGGDQPQRVGRRGQRQPGPDLDRRALAEPAGGRQQVERLVQHPARRRADRPARPHDGVRIAAPDHAEAVEQLDRPDRARLVDDQAERAFLVVLDHQHDRADEVRVHELRHRQ